MLWMIISNILIYITIIIINAHNIMFLFEIKIQMVISLIDEDVIYRFNS